jgi:heat shock protein HtpX
VNALRTTFLMALLTVLLVTAGGALGGNGGMMIAFIFALIMNGVSYWFSDWKASRHCNDQFPWAK